MPYDYSLRFLARHATLVEELIATAKNNSVKGWESKDWDQIAKQQALVNNLLASISRNMLGMENIRQVMSCWTAFGKDEMYHLYVGTESKRPKKGDLFARTYVPVEHAAGLTYSHPDVSLDDYIAQFQDFGPKLRTLDKTYRRAKIRMVGQMLEAEPAAFIAWANSEFPGWQASIDQDFLVLDR